MNSLFNSFKIALLLTISLSACHNYKPGYINSPTFEEKGDLFIDANIGSQLGGNLSYSLLNNWAVLVNAGESGVVSEEAEPGYFVNQDKAFVKSFDYPNHFYEFASGYYSRINENFFVDLYLGYGKGRSGTSFFQFDLLLEDQDLVAFRSDFGNVFLQTDFKFFASENIRFNVSGRMNILKFYDFEYVFEEPERSGSSMKPNEPLPPQEEIDAYFRNKQRIAYQLGLGFEFDLKYFLITSQVQFGMEDYDLDNPSNFYGVRPFSLFLDLSFPLHRLWKKD